PAARAGFIASSSGRASETPAPRRNVRRERGRGDGESGLDTEFSREAGNIILSHDLAPAIDFLTVARTGRRRLWYTGLGGVSVLSDGTINRCREAVRSP